MKYLQNTKYYPQRTKLGPDLVFVVLDMEIEDMVARLMVRHGHDEAAVETLKVFILKFSFVFHVIRIYVFYARIVCAEQFDFELA